MQYDSLTEAVRLLGCFSDAVDIQPLFDTNIQENDTIVQEQSLDGEVDINRVVWEEFFWKSPENQWDFVDFLHQQLFLFFIFCILLPCNKQTRSCRFFCTVTYNILFLGLMRNSPWCYNQLLFWSSSYTTWSWTHLTGTNTHTLLHISIKKNYIVKINLMYQIFKVLNSY